MLKLVYWLIISPFLIAFLIGFMSQTYRYITEPDEPDSPDLSDNEEQEPEAVQPPVAPVGVAD